jgi:hypothetical protein
MFLAPLNKTLNPNLDKGVLQPTIILVKFVIIVGHGKFPPTTIHHPQYLEHLVYCVTLLENCSKHMHDEMR